MKSRTGRGFVVALNFSGCHSDDNGIVTVDQDPYHELRNVGARRAAENCIGVCGWV